MRKCLSLMWVCLATVALAGCSKSGPEKMMDDTLSKMNDMISVLKSVTDETSARAAAPKLKSISDDIMKLTTSAEAKAVAAASPEERAKLLAKFNSAAMDLSKQMTAERMRITKLGPKVTSAMDFSHLGA